MESIIIVLFTLAVLSFTLQLALFKIRAMMFGWMGAISVFIYLMHTLAIEQSYSVFLSTLQNNSLIMDFVVFQVMEALGGILISIYLIRSHYDEPVKKFLKYCIYLPGIVVFPAVFYFETFVFLQMPGIDFMMVAVIVAIAIPLIIYLLTTIFSIGIPEFNLQIELKFMFHIIQLVGAMWLSVILLRLPVHQAKASEGSLSTMLAILVIVVLGIVLGFVWSRERIKRIAKKI